MMGNLEMICEKSLTGEAISQQEAIKLYKEAPLSLLVFTAGTIRKKLHPDNKVGYIIDRNVNITNICFSQCLFCNFCKRRGDPDSFITNEVQYREKIEELFRLGGDQLLLQCGMNPELGLRFYKDLFISLKRAYPSLKLHALGPPEIVYLAKREGLSYSEVLKELINAGLDSLPGAGAEILSDRVRKMVSPAKATTTEWLEVMREAHKLNLPTSATMMAGHVETIEERIIHLISLREVQSEKPENSYGFITFVPWPFMEENTRLYKEKGIKNNLNGFEYIKLIAISRIVLNNIPNIQASLLTVGKDVAMMSLHAGANDLGSVMIEENVVSSAGTTWRYNAEEIMAIIREAGFIPYRRNQRYEPFE